MKKKSGLLCLLFFLVVNGIYCGLYYIYNRATIRLNAEIDNNTRIELYYADETEPFSDERMVIGTWNKNRDQVSFGVPDNGTRVIRIDFSNEISEVKFYSLSYINNPFCEKKLTANDVRNCICAANNISKIEFEDNNLHFTTLGRDGNFVIKGYEDLYSLTVNKKFFLNEILFLIISILFIKWKSIYLYLKENINYKNLNYKVLLYCTAVILLGMLIAYHFSPQKSLIFILIFVAVTSEAIRLSIKFCFDFSEKDILGFIECNKVYFILLIVSLIGYLPLLSIPFTFHDEYMTFPGYKIVQINYSYGRGVQSLLAKIFSSVKYDSIYYTRWFAASFAILFTFIMYKYLLNHTKRKKYSFVLALILGATNVVVDCIAYAAIMSYMYGIFLMALSFIVFEENERLTKYKYIYSFAFAFIAINAYQLVVPILILLFTIKVWHSSESFIMNIKGIIKYIFVFILCVAMYFAYLKLCTSGLGPSARSRSSIINTWTELQEKVKWFCTYIFVQAGYRAISIFTGNNIFLGQRMWADNQLKFSRNINSFFDLILYLALGLSIFLKTKEKKDILEGIYYFASIPASYIIFLILRENGYMTYYEYTLIVVLVFYYVNLMDYLFKKIKQKDKMKTILITLITLLICYNSYVYSLNGWVIPQVRTHDFVKSTLLNQLDEGKKEIYVIGTPNKWQANAYASALVNNVLVELGEDYKEYDIKNTDPDGLIGTFEQDIYESAMKKLSENEQEEFASCYYFSEDYQHYHLIQELDDTQVSRLKHLMQKCDLVPANDSEVIIIDLSWVYKV